MGGAPSQVLPGLWLGGHDVLHDVKFFVDRGINAVLSLGRACPSHTIHFRGREHIIISDVPSADLSRYFARAVRFIARSRHAADGSVYVHCAAGISRSSTCVCAYLMCHVDLTFEEALAFISSKRPAACPNEGFRKQLREFETSYLRRDLVQELAQMGLEYHIDKQRDSDEVHEFLALRAQGLIQKVHGGRESENMQQRALRLHQEARRAVEAKAQQGAMRAVRAASLQKCYGGVAGQAVLPSSAEPDSDIGLSWLFRQDFGSLGSFRPSTPPARPRTPLAPPTTAQADLPQSGREPRKSGGTKLTRAELLNRVRDGLQKIETSVNSESVRAAIAQPVAGPCVRSAVASNNHASAQRRATSLGMQVRGSTRNPLPWRA